MILAPSATVAVAFVWRTADAAVSRYLRKRELRDLVVGAQRTLSAALAYKDTSPQYRLQVQSELEQLQLLLVQTDLKKIKALTVQR